MPETPDVSPGRKRPKAVALPERARDVTPEFLLNAYANGLFPMGDPDDQPPDRIRWYSPDPRTVLDLGWQPGRHFRRLMRTHPFTVRVNSDFPAVIRGCAHRPDDGTWITQPILDLYTDLHRLGFAHSVETWRDGELVGGLYGVQLGGAFMGESMFSAADDASKVALLHLIARLRENGFSLLDAQYPTAHLARFGAAPISRHRYLARLAHALRQPCQFAPDASPPPE